MLLTHSLSVRSGEYGRFLALARIRVGSDSPNRRPRGPGCGRGAGEPDGRQKLPDIVLEDGWGGGHRNKGSRCGRFGDRAVAGTGKLRALVGSVHEPPAKPMGRERPTGRAPGSFGAGPCGPNEPGHSGGLPRAVKRGVATAGMRARHRVCKNPLDLARVLPSLGRLP